MRLRAALLLLALLGSACTTTHFGWRGRPATADPNPSGPAYLRAYKESFYQALGARFTGRVTGGQLLQRAAQSRVLFLGDHHNDDGWHAELELLLDQLQETGVRVVLGLEAVGTQDADAVRGYLQGRYQMKELRRRIRARWPGSWLDNDALDAAFYRRLLQRAAASGSAVFGLEPTPRLPLPQRDAAIAARIRSAAARWPEALVVVVVGQAHLLGEGRLIERTGLPAVALAARMSTPLRRALQDEQPPAPHGVVYLETAPGVFVRWRPRQGFIPRPGPSATS